MQTFDSVKNYIEKNYAGFNDKVTASNYQQYNALSGNGGWSRFHFPLITNNIEAYTNLIMQTPLLEKDKQDNLSEMTKAANSKTLLYNFFGNTVDTLKVQSHPIKIAVIIDKSCASTAEQFLLEVM